MAELTRNLGDLRCYYYLNEKNSKLYDEVKDSYNSKDIIIKELLEEIASKEVSISHCRQ